MEPRRDDGDDLSGLNPCVGGGSAAMEPRRDDGDDPGGVCLTFSDWRAAMEPRRDDGDDGSQHTCRLTCNVTPSCERCWSARR